MSCVLKRDFKESRLKVSCSVSPKVTLNSGPVPLMLIHAPETRVTLSNTMQSVSLSLLHVNSVYTPLFKRMYFPILYDSKNVRKLLNQIYSNYSSWTFDNCFYFVLIFFNNIGKSYQGRISLLSQYKHK